MNFFESFLRRDRLQRPVPFPNDVETRTLSPVAIKNGVTLAAIAKCESRYLPEWLAHHLAIGFDRILVFSNESPDHQDDILAAVAAADHRVRFIGWPTLPGVSTQISAYRRAVDLCVTPWICFIDVDEFVTPLEDDDIHLWLASVPNDVSSVHVNWRGFGSRDGLPDDYGLVTRAFDMASLRSWSNNHHYKSFARAALIEDVSVHNIVMRQGRRTLSDFGDFETVDDGLSQRIAHHRIQINHYQCKTFTEFQARMRIGRASVDADSPHRFSRPATIERFRDLDRREERDVAIRRFDRAFERAYERICRTIAEAPQLERQKDLT